jgi:hypothetical protein
MTGMREQEVAHTCWADVNPSLGTVRISAKSHFAFSPKNYKGREIPIPASLVESLKSAKPKSAIGSSLIFPTSGGKPRGDFLDILKARAEDAGLDPDSFWLHKFRATFATWHLQAGVDLRTVQAWLGHTDLSSTMRYLTPAQGVEVQRKVNHTFAAMGHALCVAFAFACLLIAPCHIAKAETAVLPDAPISHSEPISKTDWSLLAGDTSVRLLDTYSTRWMLKRGDQEIFLPPAIVNHTATMAVFSLSVVAVNWYGMRLMERHHHPKLGHLLMAVDIGDDGYWAAHNLTLPDVRAHRDLRGGAR